MSSPKECAETSRWRKGVLQEVLEIGRVLFADRNRNDSGHAVLMAFKATPVDLRNVDPLAGEDEAVRGAQVGGKCQLEARPRSAFPLPSSNTRENESTSPPPMPWRMKPAWSPSASSVDRAMAENPSLPLRKRQAWSRFTKCIASERGRLAGFPVSDRQRLQIGAVLQENAAVFGSERMARIRRNGETQRLHAAAAPFPARPPAIPDGRAHADGELRWPGRAGR